MQKLPDLFLIWKKGKYLNTNLGVYGALHDATWFNIKEVAERYKMEGDVVVRVSSAMEPVDA